MKRWTKKIDLFSMEYIVIPINAYKHWNSMIIVSPGALLSQASQCKIIYLDSMCQKKSIFSEAIKKYLQFNTGFCNSNLLTERMLWLPCKILFKLINFWSQDKPILMIVDCILSAIQNTFSKTMNSLTKIWKLFAIGSI